MSNLESHLEILHSRTFRHLEQIQEDTTRPKSQCLAKPWQSSNQKIGINQGFAESFFQEA